ncbi:MAG: response regulator transcription factor [Bacteroidota bacterium]
MTNVTLGLVEDEPLVLETLELYLGAQADMEVAITADSMESFLERLATHRTPVINTVLLDINLPGMSGLEGIRHIREKINAVDIIMLTAYDDSDRVFKALCAGAVSYLTKGTDLPTIRDVLRTVHGGGSYMSPGIARKVIGHFAPKKRRLDDPLTPRQAQIVEGLVDGLSYKMIADKYLISVETVRDHIKKIYRKLQVNSKAEVIRKKLDGEI